MIVDMVMCACGSGLRAARCCQMDFSRLPPRDAVRPLLPLVEQAVQHHASGAVAAAESLYRRVLELTGRRDPIVLANLAWNLKNQGKMAESRRLYEEAAARDPAVLHTLLGWARMEEADRNFDQAAVLLDRAEQLAPGHPSVLLSRAVLYGRTRRYAQALAVLDGIAGRAGEGGGLGANELLEKGRLLDRMGRYEEAFAAFAEGKRLCREVSGLVYLAAEAQQLADRLKGFFTETRLAILPRAGIREDGAQPLFILDFPRSGTTLVEQTLSAHPRISAGDELPFVNEIADAMPRLFNSPLTYHEALAELWMGDHRHGLDEFATTISTGCAGSLSWRPEPAGSPTRCP